jgi:Predicted flavoproteins
MTKTNNLPGCKKYDIAIIGAGPAGIMAAISASIFLKSQVKNSFDKKDAAKITRQEQDFISANSFTDKNSENANGNSIISNSANANIGSSSSSSICIIERNESAAKKLLLTGNGRCNYTAAVDKDDLVLAFGKKGRFFSDAFNELSNRDLIDFFKKEGIEPEYEKPDENGNLVKVFPKNKNASSILQCLTCILQENNIHVFYGFRVEKILKVKNPGETGEKSLFEILPFNGCRFANPSNNNPDPDDKKIGSSSYGSSAAGNYVLSKKC